jgi:hypothetical protein
MKPLFPYGLAEAFRTPPVAVFVKLAVDKNTAEPGEFVLTE